jgi:predicted Zn-dependent protease
MLGRDKALEILHKALECSSADQTMVTLESGESSLTRFANSKIHQNVSEYNARLGVRVAIGKRLGYATTNKLDDNSIKSVVQRAINFAKHSAENSDFVSFPGPKPIKEIPSFDQQTANYSPEDRATAVRNMVSEATKLGASAAGSFSTGYEEFAVVNSLGINAYEAISLASLTTVMTADNGSGYADRVSERVGDFDPVEVAVEAAKRSVESQNPEPIDPGEYDVVLLPYAVAELLDFLAYMGFSALAVQEGRSFMCGRFGEQITGDNITIWDDGLDPRGLPRPFDPEGVPKQRVDLIVRGRANAVVYDSYTAHREGKESTGHATGGPGYFGPYPTNMFMEPGDSSVEEMIASTKKGIFVTRFHYVNVIHPISTTITGMTRDGTFLIENGRIIKPVRNLRFTDNVLERLSNVEMISKETKCEGIAVVPAIKVKGFRFTGVTEF